MNKSRRRSTPQATPAAGSSSMPTTMAPARSPRPAERPPQSYIDHLTENSEIPEYILTCPEDWICFDDDGGNPFDGGWELPPTRCGEDCG